MKSKITLFLVLIMLPVMNFMGSVAFAQTVTGTTGNTGCSNSGFITASSTGLGTTPEYQLLKSGIVIAPIPGNDSRFATSVNAIFKFESLENGNYTVKARASSLSDVFTSATIVVKDGYTNMSVSAQGQMTNCSGGKAVLSAKVVGGKAPFTYRIALQSSSGTYLQTSTSTTASTFAYNALAAGVYTVSATDACGQTVTAATSITSPTVTVNDIKLNSRAYFSLTTATDCNSVINTTNESGFVYSASGNSIAAADAARFTWKLRFQNDLYGIGGVKNGTGFALSDIKVPVPVVATRSAILADEIGPTPSAIVVLDECGNQKVFPIVNINKTISTLTAINCQGVPYVISHSYSGLACFPMDVTFTNTANPADVVKATLAEGNFDMISGFTPGAKYNYTYVDAAGYTSDLWVNSTLTMPVNTTFNPSQRIVGVQQNLNKLGYGILQISMPSILPGQSGKVEVLASTNTSAVPIGKTISNIYISTSGYMVIPAVNPTDPYNYWPRGTYTLRVSTDCGSKDIVVNVAGYEASLNDDKITPICGGFDYVMIGVFDTASAYEVVVVSGPSNVGQTRNLASTKESLPFTSLSYGAYVFGLRIKGGSTNVLTRSVTYNPGEPIKIERAKTGGYVCTEGAQDGILTITASTISSAPNNVLTYAISKDGGATYLPATYQTSNLFTGLASGTYRFKVKDGCGNEITEAAQIGVASAPIATANGIADPTLCMLSSGSVQLDVDIPNAAYLWKGPGITTANQNLKDPVINYSDLVLGINNYSCTITLGAPCNTINVAKLVITATSSNVKVTNPAAVCYPEKVDLTAKAITSGSDLGLLYSYFTDSEATKPLTAPEAVAVSGTYYIKGTNSNSCETIVPVIVKVNSLPTAAISYPIQSYCNRGTVAVKQTGLTGGTYSGDTGLVVNATTGLINLASSTEGSHTVTYTFNDGTCPNTATASINITATVLPTALPDVTAQCSVATIAAPTLTDPCAGIITATTTTSFPITKSGDTDVTWIFNYGNGYTQSIIQKVSIKDTMAPVVGLLPDLNAQCSLMPDAPTATDNCDSGIITGTTTTLFPITKQGLTVISWTFKDSSGNSSTALQNVNIKDTTAPVVPVLADITGQCSVMPKIPTTTDNCSGTIAGATKTVFPITKVGKTVVTWTFDDGNGNIVTADQNVIISNVTLVETASTICAADGSGYTLKLNVSGDAPYIATGTGAPGTWSGNEWTSGNIPAGTNYNVDIQDKNACNTLTVSDVAPICCVFEVVAPTFSPSTITCYDQLPTAASLTKAEFEALGNGNGTIGNIPCGIIEITAANSADPDCNGSVIRTYTVTEYADTNNNKVRDLGEDTVLDSVTFTQTFIIEKADFVMPANTGKTITCPASIVTPEVPEVKDNCGNILVANTPVISAIPSCNGDVTYTYTFTDCTGNAHDWIYTYTIDNTVAPSGKAPADLLVQCIDDIPAANINAVTNTVANCNGSIDITVADTNNGGKGCKGDPYIVTRTFTLTDCGGLTTNLVQKITAEDTTAPVFVETLPTNIVVDCSNEIPEAATLTATDNCSTANVAYQEVKVNGSCSGNYELQRTWTATDSCGNETTHTQIITIVDTTAPVFVESLPEVEVNATCETIPSVQTLTATDSCGTATVEYTETKVDGYCSSKYDLVRTWVASDDCGNQNRFTQTIHVSCLPEIYNAISPNGDGLNDKFTIAGIDCYPNNNLRIYNRYGVLVYEKQGYDNVTNPFEGFSDGRATLKRGDKLPTGTYFYTLEYNDDNKNKVEKAGYLYINNN